MSRNLAASFALYVTYSLVLSACSEPSSEPRSAARNPPAPAVQTQSNDGRPLQTSLSPASAQTASVDPVLRYLARPRFYIIISVNKIAAAEGATLPYALVDAGAVKTALEAAGFKPLSKSPPLTGDTATHDNIEKLLRAIRGLPDKSTVLIYYSGHAWTDDSKQEVWLQLASNTILGDQGWSIADLLTFPRADGWSGELALVVDSCYSGKAAFHSDLTGETVLLASSNQREPSRPMQLPDGQRMSAFTHALLLAAGSDFSQANTAHDGILTFDQVASFAASELLDWKDQNQIDGPMHPVLFENTYAIVLRYDSSKTVAMNSPMRRIILHRLIDENIPGFGPSSADSPAPQVGALTNIQKTIVELLNAFPDGDERRALAEFSTGDTLKGLTDLEKANDAALPGSDPNAERLLARLYTSAGFDTEASRLYTQMLAKDTSPSPALVREAASSFIRARAFDRAETLLASSLKTTVQPASKALAFNDLGVLYAQKSEYTKAEVAYKDALSSAHEAAPPDRWVATINSNLADTYRMQGRFSDAEKQFAHTVELDKKAGADTNKQIADLEKYSTVLGTAKKPKEARAAKMSAEVMKAEVSSKSEAVAIIK
ncbi:MAG: hypothetical protein C5B58_06890 [Acidobacteria bacterium]|nr:MAG: hypothetical protein C5B58_06890 [Acidobacteriota bacterium]